MLDDVTCLTFTVTKHDYLLLEVLNLQESIRHQKDLRAHIDP